MASSITLGNNIYRLRKDARLTQDDLATFLGVTKASVSKWETGQSFPDIELLPKIATYFGVTVDDLIGYEPQMAKEAIACECARLRTAFAEKPFEEVHAQCQQLAGNAFDEKHTSVVKTNKKSNVEYGKIYWPQVTYCPSFRRSNLRSRQSPLKA